MQGGMSQIGSGLCNRWPAECTKSKQSMQEEWHSATISSSSFCDGTIISVQAKIG